MLGIIGNTESKMGTWRMKKWSLVFTTDRVFVVKVSGTLGMVASSLGGAVGSIQDFKTRGKMGDVSGGEIDSLEAFLEEDEDNVAISRSDIEGVEMKKGGLLSPYKIIFHTGGKDYEFNLIERNRFDEYKEMIRDIFPEKTL
ncbi:hypothetical protein GF319_15770 [Candidatus Bathyarchaeota archaeon]|nr:hypothetical protein [Candidatus Bathyarchaeota archaeon]